MSEKMIISVFVVFALLSGILFARADEKVWQMVIGATFLIGTAIFAYINLNGK